jgi:hypothetical protein
LLIFLKYLQNTSCHKLTQAHPFLYLKAAEYLKRKQ